MTRRLVITNGDWVTRHEIGETDIVIGRDPKCDLFFVNQKLSRRHARVEPGPDGVRLVDLGSRNGVWVNEKRIDQHLLAPGDSIRLGGLRIVFEESDADPRHELEGADTTVLEGVDATVALSGRVAATLADARSAEHASWGKATDSESPEATAIISPSPVQLVPPVRDDRTVVLQDVAGGTGLDGTATVILGEVEVPEPEPLVVRVSEKLAAWPWPTKFFATIFGLSVLLGGLLVELIRVGSWVAGVLFGLLFASLLARFATVLARKLLVEPVARLERDADALESGGSLSPHREYPELEELAKRVNRLTGRIPETARKEETHGAS